MTKIDDNGRLRQASACLSASLRKKLLPFINQLEGTAMEIRLRLNRPLMIICINSKYYITADGNLTSSINDKYMLTVTKSDIEETEPLIRGVVEGLVGAGTNTFQSETVQEAYISYMTDSFIDDVAKIRKMYVKYNKNPAYEAVTNKIVEDTKKMASSSDNDKLFENIRRNVEYNPEEREQIVADVNQLATAIKIQGRNFTKKYMNDIFFKSVCDYIANVYAPFAKKAKIDRTISDYVRYYLRKIEKNNVEAA